MSKRQKKTEMPEDLQGVVGTEAHSITIDEQIPKLDGLINDLIFWTGGVRFIALSAGEYGCMVETRSEQIVGRGATLERAAEHTFEQFKARHPKEFA